MSQPKVKRSVRHPSPASTRHIKRKLLLNANGSAAKTPATLAAELAARLEELRTLPELVKKHFKWDNGAREFQLQGMEAQVLGKDVFLHAATGSGKTGIAAGPHLLPSNKGKVTLFISPLLSLHAEQVCCLS
jgi:superfamily II DNA helicase RecQ